MAGMDTPQGWKAAILGTGAEMALPHAAHYNGTAQSNIDNEKGQAAMTETAALLAELARAKAAFQQRTIVALLQEGK
jgi:hypothetical protein